MPGQRRPTLARHSATILFVSVVRCAWSASHNKRWSLSSSGCKKAGWRCPHLPLVRTPRPLQPPRHLPASLPCHATSWILMAALVCHSSITSTSSSQGQKYNLMPRQHYHAAAIAASSVLFAYVAVALDLLPYIAGVYVLLAYIAVVVLLDDIAVMLLFISCWLTLQ